MSMFDDRVAEYKPGHSMRVVLQVVHFTFGWPEKTDMVWHHGTYANMYPFAAGIMELKHQ